MKKTLLVFHMVCIAGIILAQKTPGVRIEAGGTANYTDTKGNIWFADGYSDAAGGSVDRGSITIAGTNDPRIYQTERYCMNNYNIPIVNGTYTVNLHFAETNGDTIGQRVFDVNVGGQSLNNLDVRAQAGGVETALIKTFTNVNVTNGYLLITFTPHAGSDCPEINGIEIPVDSIPHPPVEPIPASLFGMQFHGDVPTDCSIGIYGKGAGNVWVYTEPSRGVFDWSGLDFYTQAAQAHGIPFAYCFESVPPWAIAGPFDTIAECSKNYLGEWACPVMPSNITDWDNYVDSVVTRYKGKIAYYELWNEPYDVYGDSLIQLPASGLAILANHAVSIIRSVDPAAKIIAPDFGGTHWCYSYASAYYAASGPTDVDINSIHAYASNYPCPDPSVGIYSTDPLCEYPEDILLSSNDNASYPTALQAIFNQYVPGKPLWNTEGSWNNDTPGLFSSSDTAIDHYLKAGFIARWYILHWSTGISSMNWNNWDDQGLGTMCTAEPWPTPYIPIAVLTTAYTQTYNWLVGAKMPSSCVESPDSTWTCGLTRPSGYQGLIVWNTTGNRSYTPPNPSTWSRYRDLAGDTIPYSGGSVTIGIQPILFENTGSVTGINKIYAKDEVIKISPNPARDKIYFQTTSPNLISLNVNIFSIEGKLLINKNMNLQTEKMLDVSSLALGIYFVQFINNVINQNQKIIIVR